MKCKDSNFWIGLGIGSVSYTHLNLFPQLESGSLLPCILTGCLLFFAVSLLNILAIGKKIISIWKGGK